MAEVFLLGEFCEHKTAVIIGFTTGIGAVIARLLAKLGCSRIIIFGRNETWAASILQDMQKLAPHKIQVEYIKSDLSDTKGMRASAKAIQNAVMEHGIDYLVMCQNGVPTGMIVENADDIERGFAVQAVSRFAIAFFLTTWGCLAQNAQCLSVANVGQTFKAGRGKTMSFMDQSKRDRCVLDAFTEFLFKEFNIRYPQYRYHQVSYGKFPFPLNGLMMIGMKIIGTTPDAFANVPVYVTPPNFQLSSYFQPQILLAPEGQDILGSGKFLAYNLAQKEPGA
ncbi:hypothetical protein BDP27DRAFT_1382338 [Rhodocollybia butyracea]|uniref:Uncharacterized protein n=1 Tax=Rhodocollybia butyracea TaxID=206335 RepID=A0A9P5U955_9AGAR|nr:hypothetical protein BDP27DRAFT_1382338 [Rhodocollybia butyracea]